MSNVAKLKKQAAEFELKKQPDKALAIYIKLLENFDQYPNELDVALFNRVGDLQLKQGNVADAVDYYERAVDKYAEGGFFNNAIALCNKILRQSPGRATVYYKLGKISAHKGFKADAKQNFLEYAERMQKAGNVDEAFRALAEFADLCPDQDDIRLMLAEQLVRADRPAEAIEQLQTLYERFVSEGRTAEATATVERMQAIDPAVQPREGGGQRRAATDDLIFIDLDDSPRPAVRTPPRSTAPVPPASPPPAAPDRPTPRSSVAMETPVPEQLVGFETTQIGGADDAVAPSIDAGGLEIEHTALGELPAVAEDVTPSATEAVDAGSPAEEDAESEGPALEFILPDADDDGAGTTPAATTPVSVTPVSSPSLEFLDIELTDHSDDDTPRSTPTQLPFVEVDATPAWGSSVEADDEGALEIPAVPPRPSTIMAAHSVDILRAAVEGEPDDWGLRRELAEAMFDAGDRAGGMEHLEAAMNGAETANDLSLAASLAEELARLEPDAVRHHQKRVEYAFRRNDRGRLTESYLALGDALLRAEQIDKARTVYQRVVELAPDDARARMALEALPTMEPIEPSAPPPPPARRASVPSTPASAPAPAPGTAETFVNLGDWLRDEEEPKDTRMVVAEQEPTGDEDADFADMLRQFKQGVAENVDAEDYQSHYDLAIAYKEMGLIDEAIQGFQKALGARDHRLPTYEALGQCFLEKGQPRMAANILQRALSEPGASEEKLVGVLYLMGRATEALDRPAEALDYYQRVFVLDIQFQDVADRIAALERSAR